MKEFNVKITEILEKNIKIKAKNKNEALKIIQKSYFDEKIILNADDFTKRYFYAKENETNLSSSN